LFAIATSNIASADGFKFFRTNYLRLDFKNHLKKPWCIDGEKFENDGLEYEIKIDKTVKMMLPKKALKEDGVIIPK